jgi:hypothetical protein
LKVTPAAFDITIFAAALEVNKPEGIFCAEVPLKVTVPLPLVIVPPGAGVLTVPPSLKICPFTSTMPAVNAAAVSTLNVEPSVAEPLLVLLTVKLATPLVVGLVVWSKNNVPKAPVPVIERMLDAEPVRLPFVLANVPFNVRMLAPMITFPVVSVNAPTAFLLPDKVTALAEEARVSVTFDGTPVPTDEPAVHSLPVLVLPVL